MTLDVSLDNVLDLINANLGGFNNAMELRFTKAVPDEYAAELEITDSHLQPYGLVHGGYRSGSTYGFGVSGRGCRKEFKYGCAITGFGLNTY